MIYDLKLGGSQFAQNGCKCIDFVIGSFIETTWCDWVLSPQPTCNFVSSNHYCRVLHSTGDQDRLYVCGVLAGFTLLP